MIDVITVDESWWPTRVKQGVHLLHPTPAQLENGKRVAHLIGTNTVYQYTNTRNL